MAGIVTLTLTESGEGSNKALRIANGEMARALTIGNAWSEIAIGVRIKLNGNATYSSSNKLRVGLCSGPAGYVAPVTHSIYLELPLPYTKQTGGFVQSGSSGAGLFLNIDDVITKIVSIATAQYQVPSSDEAAVVSYAFLVSTSQGSNHFDGAVVYPRAIDSTTPQLDNHKATLNNLEFALEQAVGGNAVTTQATSIATGLNTQIGGSANFSSTSGLTTTARDDVTNGPLDNIFMYWTQSTPELDIADVTVARYAT